MKKLLIFVFVFVMSIQICSAKNSDKDYSLNFNGIKYHLLYSVKNKDFGGYLNEYYRQGETYNIWTDMVAIHHFPNAYSPIDRIKDFKNYLSSMNVPSSLTFDDRKNAAMIDFIIIKSDKVPVVLEFNIFKYEKSKKCGSVAVQYVKRYSATTTMQVEQIKDDFEKSRKKLLKNVKKFTIPQIITEDIDKCISGTEVRKQDTAEEESAKAVNDENTKEETAPKNEAETTVNEEAPVGQIAEPANEKPAEEPVEPNKPEENAAEPETNSDESSVQEIKKEESVTEVKTPEKEEPKPVVTAPVPQVTDKETDVIQETKADKKQKENIKNSNYQIINDKDDFYAKPRTKKELKELKKEYKKNLKLKNTAYEVVNNKDDFIAEPRSKKEMKEYQKELKAKQKAKSRKKKK